VEETAGKKMVFAIIIRFFALQAGLLKLYQDFGG